MKKDHRIPMRQIIAGNTTASQRPDELTLAAWLEGHLSGPEADQVEAWLCHDPALRKALTSETIAPQPLQASELVRATALVPAEESQRPSWFDWLFSPLPAWAMAAMIAAIGFWLGSGLGTVPDRDERLLSAILTGLPL